MNTLDLMVIVAAVSAGIGGYRLGFIARAASWAGLAVGFYVGIRIVPDVVGNLESRDPAARLLIAAVVLIGSALVGQLLGFVMGSQLRKLVAPGPIALADKAVGGATGVLGVAMSLWLLLPSMAQVPGWAAQQARQSKLAQTLHAVTPEPPNALQVVRRLVGEEAFPRVFESLRPSPDLGPPPGAVAMSPELQAAVAASTVKVEAVACKRLLQGSGWAAGPELIVTNAHVVAGTTKTVVLRPDRRRLAATVVAFDSDTDLAVLRVPGLGQAPLPIEDGEVGDQGAVFGHPEGQDALAITPAAIRQRVDANGRDLYDNHPTQREVFILSANLHQGDSGGALVDSGGKVVGVAFAIAPDRRDTAYALTSDEVRRVLARAGGRVDAGPCLTS